MIGGAEVPLFDLVKCLSQAIDLVDPIVANHHEQVSYIAVSIARARGATVEQQNDVMLAALLHDIGALSLGDRLHTLEFELPHGDRHAESGWLLLKSFKPFSAIAPLVRYHHHPWNPIDFSARAGKVPLGSQIIHLADRVSVLINKEQEVLGQVSGVSDRIREHAGRMFSPQLVNAFLDLANKEYFWLDAVSPMMGNLLAREAKSRSVSLRLDAEVLLGLARLFSRIIDFRSRFTATHSSGVAACAEALARLAGFSDGECTMMRIAGYLHDLGKLAVPVEILEKPGPLTPEERNLIRVHTYHTYRILENIDQLHDIKSWASFHHERLDGTGYPFHLDGRELSLATRIMAVADIFTAVIEDRPYRKGMAREDALGLLQRMSQAMALDSHVVEILTCSFDEVNSYREASQAEAFIEYEEFRRYLLGEGIRRRGKNI